jgi:hypothetical protein
MRNSLTSKESVHQLVINLLGGDDALSAWGSQTGVINWAVDGPGANVITGQCRTQMFCSAAKAMTC